MNNINWNSAKVRTIVKKEIKESPDNLSQAFERAAAKLNTSKGNLSFHWYSKLRFDEAFIKLSGNDTYINKKNTKRMGKSRLILEKVVSSKTHDGIRVETIKRYFG